MLRHLVHIVRLQLTNQLSLAARDSQLIDEQRQAERDAHRDKYVARPNKQLDFEFRIEQLTDEIARLSSMQLEVEQLQQVRDEATRVSCTQMVAGEKCC